MALVYSLKWEGYIGNMMNACKKILSTEEMADVTLACDGRRLKVHKFILSAYSPFFQSLLLENPCKHPIVILKDVKYSELKAVVEFMYHGEVNVSEDQVSAVVKVAEALKIKGLGMPVDENHSTCNEVEFSCNTAPKLHMPPKWAGIGSRKRSASNSSIEESFDLRQKKHSSELNPQLYTDISSPVLKDSVSFPSTNSIDKTYQHQEGEKREKIHNETCLPEKSIQTELSLAPEKTQTRYDLPSRIENLFVEDSQPSFAKTWDQKRSIPCSSEIDQLPCQGQHNITKYSPISSPDLEQVRNCLGANLFHKSYQQQQSTEVVADTAPIENIQVEPPIDPENIESERDLQRVTDGPFIQSSMSSVENYGRSSPYTHHSESLLPITTSSDNPETCSISPYQSYDSAVNMKSQSSDLCSSLPSTSQDGAFDVKSEPLELFPKPSFMGLVLEPNQNSEAEGMNPSTLSCLPSSLDSLFERPLSRDVRCISETSVSDARNYSLHLPEGNEKGNTSFVFDSSSLSLGTQSILQVGQFKDKNLITDAKNVPLCFPKDKGKECSESKPFMCSPRSHSTSCFTGFKRHACLPTDENPFWCHICCKRFKHKWTLKRHSRIHTRNNMHEVYTRKQELKEHFLRLHTEEN